MLTNVSRRRQASEAMDQRVLIIEDEFLIALDLADTIEQMGLKVAGFAGGRKHAIELAPYADLAFVDVNLSDGRTGPELGRELAEEYGLTVVFMTANPEQVADGVDGALGVLTKPVMPETIEKTVEYALANRLGGMAVVPRELKVFQGNSR